LKIEGANDLIVPSDFTGTTNFSTSLLILELLRPFRFEIISIAFLNDLELY
jgi:hypothetical protein